MAVLDEDTNRHGRSFMGVPIAGDIDDLPDVVERTGANLAVFAMTNAPQETVRRAAAAAEEADVALKIVPGISSAMRGGVSLRDIRDVQIEDLLGREEIATDLDAVRAMLDRSPGARSPAPVVRSAPRSPARCSPAIRRRSCCSTTTRPTCTTSPANSATTSSCRCWPTFATDAR